MKPAHRTSSIALAGIMFALAVTGVVGCRRVETDHRPAATALALIYSSNVMGEIEPCG